jgi:hypothetical protein
VTVVLNDTDAFTAEDVREAAYRWHAAGFSVVPVKQNGEKRPDLKGWEAYKLEQPTAQKIGEWYDGASRTGVGVIMGAISGNVEMFELEGRAVNEGARDRLIPALKAAGVHEVWKRLVSGYAEHTPSGGIHFIYRLDGKAVPGNTKIASRPKKSEELTATDHELLKKSPNQPRPYVLAETRGEGGFVVVAPSHGRVHQSGLPWTFSKNSVPGRIETITWDERVALFAAIHAVLDEMPEPEPIAPREPAQPTSDGTERPGDAYTRQTGWADILQPHGWTLVYRRGDMDYWRRPGDDKRIGWSARTGGTYDGLWVWSTSTEFPTEVSITKFRAYAILEHNGDNRNAAAQLRRDGYGGERQGPSAPPQSAAVTEGEPKPAISTGPAWPLLRPAALHGLAGDFVRMWNPHTEADPPAVLHLFLATVGCWYGPGYFVAGGNTRHTPKVWPLICGDSSTGAKGTAVSVTRGFWIKFGSNTFQFASGLSTGEGLIKAVRDASGDDPNEQGFDEGVHDKRLWVDAPEFVSVLEKSRRDGNSLSATLREAYDDMVLQSMTSGSPVKSTGSHIVITPQITPAELVTKLSSTDVANGLANRFMLVCSRMSKTLPEGSSPSSSELKAFGDRLYETRATLHKASEGKGELFRDDAGRKLWIAEYHRRFDERRKDKSESPVKSLLARWHANTARMSLTYALLDGELTISERHVKAALAAWDYIEDSTRYVFGSEAGDKDLGRLMEYLNEREEGQGRKAVSVELFQRHKTAKELDALFDKLLARGDYEAYPYRGPNGGRPATYYRRARG